MLRAREFPNHSAREDGTHLSGGPGHRCSVWIGGAGVRPWSVPTFIRNEQEAGCSAPVRPEIVLHPPDGDRHGPVETGRAKSSALQAGYPLSLGMAVIEPVPLRPDERLHHRGKLGSLAR